MKNNVVMRLNCVECKEKHNITNETLNNYNIYFDLSEPIKGGFPHPYLLCPKCTDAAVKALKEG